MKWFTDSWDIDYKHLEVEDYGAPALPELDKIVKYIDKQIQNEKPVIIHCNGGSTRTGTILAAFLM